MVSDALSRMRNPPLVVDIDDPLAAGGERIGEIEYEALLEEGDPAYEWSNPDDEWRAISAQLHLGHHGEPEGGRLPPPRRLPQTRCPTSSAGTSRITPSTCGRCRCSTATGGASRGRWRPSGGTSVCMRRVEAGAIYRAIAGGGRDAHVRRARVVLGMILNASGEERRTFSHPVNVMTAAAPPPAAVLERMEQEGIQGHPTSTA